MAKVLEVTIKDLLESLGLEVDLAETLANSILEKPEDDLIAEITGLTPGQVRKASNNKLTLEDAGKLTAACKAERPSDVPAPAVSGPIVVQMAQPEEPDLATLLAKWDPAGDNTGLIGKIQPLVADLATNNWVILANDGAVDVATTLKYVAQLRRTKTPVERFKNADSKRVKPVSLAAASSFKLQKDPVNGEPLDLDGNDAPDGVSWQDVSETMRKFAYWMTHPMHQKLGKNDRIDIADVLKGKEGKDLSGRWAQMWIDFEDALKEKWDVDLTYKPYSQPTGGPDAGRQNPLGGNTTTVFGRLSRRGLVIPTDLSGLRAILIPLPDTDIDALFLELSSENTIKAPLADRTGRGNRKDEKINLLLDYYRRINGEMKKAFVRHFIAKACEMELDVYAVLSQPEYSMATYEGQQSAAHFIHMFRDLFTPDTIRLEWDRISTAQTIPVLFMIRAYLGNGFFETNYLKLLEGRYLGMGYHPFIVEILTWLSYGDDVLREFISRGYTGDMRIWDPNLGVITNLFSDHLVQAGMLSYN